MKKLFVFFFLAGWVLFVSAQEDKNTVTLERKNVLKFLPVNLPFQSLSFEFERMINAKNSITLGIGLPNQKSIIGKYGIDGSSDLKTAELGTMHLRAAYRHYTGKSMLPRGFYIEPYLKYQEIKGAASISGTDSQTNQPYTGDLNAKFNTMNVGLQFGAQFLIGKRISLDFYFLGLEAGMLTGDATAVTNAPTDAINIADDINKAKNDNLPAFIADKITVTQSGNQVNAKVSSVPYPWIRGGISIGFAF
jgi:hypothetical protein